jgi:hypothetical protein
MPSTRQLAGTRMHGLSVTRSSSKTLTMNLLCHDRFDEVPLKMVTLRLACVLHEAIKNVRNCQSRTLSSSIRLVARACHRKQCHRDAG